MSKDYTDLQRILELLKDSSDEKLKMCAHGNDIVKQLELNDHRTSLLLHHLSDLGYISSFERLKTYHSLSFKGLLFLNSGGFKRQERLDKRARIANWVSDWYEILFKPFVITALLVGIATGILKIIEFFKC